MNEWSVSKTWAIAPPSGADYDAAYVVRLRDESGATHDMIVEFEAPSAVASVGYAEEIFRRFRRQSAVPAHVTVDVQRVVRVVGDDPGESKADAVGA